MAPRGFDRGSGRGRRSGVQRFASEEFADHRTGLLKPERGDDGLYVQPEDFSPERETREQHNRDAFAAHFKYADPFTGWQRTYDDKGDYNCGRCNQADGEKCLLHTGAHSLDILSVHLALLGVDFEVHEPPELIENLRVLVKRLSRASA